MIIPNQFLEREETINMLRKLKLSTRIMLMGIIIILCYSLIFVWILPKREVSQILYVFLGALSMIVVFGLGLFFVMSRSISRPINQIIEGLSNGADQVTSGSSQVSSSSQSLAQGSSQQAASLEETSSSIEEMA